jgi:hypothetical protein
MAFKFSAIKGLKIKNLVNMAYTYQDKSVGSSSSSSSTFSPSVFDSPSFFSSSFSSSSSSS